MWCHTGMAGKNELDNALLGGASDYMADISIKMLQWYEAKDEDKVRTVYALYYTTGCVDMCMVYPLVN